jgi:CBS domain-containing protein
MLTGHGSAAAKTALGRGAFDFLSKPCDIDLLVSKILEARAHRAAGGRPEERRVGDVMIPRGDYTTVAETATVGEAIRRLRESFTSHEAGGSVMETVHRSVLVTVTDDWGRVTGILSIADLLRAIRPGYLTAPRPTTVDTIQYSPLFWTGMFTREVKALGGVEVADVMSPSPPTVDADAPLLEAAYQMVHSGERRLLPAISDLSP